MCGAWVRWETEERRKGEPVWPRLTMYWTSGHLNKSHWGNSLMVQWLGLSVHCRVPGSILGGGT